MLKARTVKIPITPCARVLLRRSLDDIFSEINIYLKNNSTSAKSSFFKPSFKRDIKQDLRKLKEIRSEFERFSGDPKLVELKKS